MKALKTIWNVIVGILKILLYGWIIALRGILRAWLELLVRCIRLRKIPKRQRKTAKNDCVPINQPSFVHPDPMIYAQFYLMQLGFAVTWDNPDIQLYRDGVAVSSALLEPDTVYDVVARIWNNSTQAPIKSLPVRFSFLSFGIGTQSNPIGDTAVDLGVKGGPNHPAFAVMKWRTPSVAGHFCLQVFLDWLDDANPFNNLGQENTNVGKLHSPVTFEFSMRNATTAPQTYHFELDTYQLPELLPCGERTTFNNVDRTAEAKARNNRQNFPLPAGWSVALTPSQLQLEAGEEQTVEVTVNAPDNFHGQLPINVHAFFGQEQLAGGVTLFIERD